MADAPQGQTTPPAGGPSTGGGTGMDPKVAATIAYVLGFVTGIIFLLIEKDKFVRFHAIQSIGFSIAWVVLEWVLVALIIFIPFLNFITIFIPLVFFVLWIILMVKAYQGEKFKLPLIGDIAERSA